MSFGPDYDEERDGPRIRTQMERIRGYMLSAARGRRWVTLQEISTALGYPTASISAQLRHLRKVEHGAYRVQKQIRVGHKGTWEYLVLAPRENLQLKMEDI